MKGKIRREGPLSSLRAPNPEYRITIATDDNDGARAALQAAGQEAEAVDAPPGLSVWKLAVEDRGGMNHILDQVRSGGFEIEEVQRIRASLEEVFVQTIEDAGQADADAGGPGGIQTGRATASQAGGSEADHG